MKKSAIKWLYKVSGKYKLQILFLIIIQIVLGLSGVFFALFMRNAIDFAVEKDSSGFRLTFCLLIAITVGQIVLRAVIRHLEESGRSSIENALKARLFSCLMKKDFSQVTAIHSGEWINRLTSDTSLTANGIVEILPNVAGMITKVVGAMTMILAIEPRFSVILFPAALVIILISYFFRRVIKKLHKNVQHTDGLLRIFLQERLGSLTIIRSFAAEEYTEEDAAKKMTAHKKARMKKNHFSNLCNIGFAAAMNGFYLLGMGYCGYGIIAGSLSYGTLMAILQLVGQIQTPFANISGYLPRFYAMLASAERLIEAESFDNDCDEKIKDFNEIHEYYTNNFDKINLKNISFCYPDNDKLTVLDNISFEIKKGDYVAFVGHSGCGKSTILKLLMGLYKLNEGEITVSDINGVNQNLTSEWHRLFAYVPQGSQLMNGSIMEIVGFSIKKEDIDREKVMKALKIACADEFINELEDGIDTVLGERGSGLSEGQTQRIAIARAVFSDCPILLLDESTSALDEKTEARLLENLKNMTDKTVLTITHRPATLDICSRILEVNEGYIREVQK